VELHTIIVLLRSRFFALNYAVIRCQRHVFLSLENYFNDTAIAAILNKILALLEFWYVRDCS